MNSHTTLIFLLVLSINGCATSPQEEDEFRGSRANPAAYSMENFTFGRPKKNRPATEFDFYYKHCTVDERKPFPTGAIWQCTTP